MTGSIGNRKKSQKMISADVKTSKTLVFPKFQKIGNKKKYNM